MVKGFSVPLSPTGLASMVPTPPWYYVGTNMAVEFVADVNKIAEFLPQGLEPCDGRCSAFFCDWQTASVEQPEAYLNPSYSQYKEAVILMTAKFQGKEVTYCPFIYVDNDGAAMRGQVYGYPKQLAQVFITRTFNIDSHAAPKLEKGGKLGAYASMDCGRLFEMQMELTEPTTKMAQPHFANAVGLRHFPNLCKADGYKPTVLDLVRGKGYDAKAADMWTGKGQLKIYSQSQPELAAFEPLEVGDAYYMLDSHTTDDMEIVMDLR